MNRAERRRLQREGKKAKAEPTYYIKGSEVQNIKTEVKDEAVYTAITLLFALPIKVLQEEYGWGSKKRLPEFAEKLEAEYQKFAEGKVTLNEYADLIYKSAGIKIKGVEK